MLFGSKIKSITAQEVMKQKITNIIDVREEYEFVEGHILEAKNMPLSSLESYHGTQPVYVICQSGMRSKNATKKLVRQGIDAINIEGGMNQWRGKTKRGK